MDDKRDGNVSKNLEKYYTLFSMKMEEPIEEK
jgi:hypothetical protein